MPSHVDHYFWVVKNFKGGLAEDSKEDIAGAHRYGIGLDFRSDSGLIKIAKKPTKDSTTIITKLVKWLEINPATNDLYAYAEDTIYKKGSPWSSVRSIGAGTPNGQGLCDFNGYLYYRTGTTLGRFDYSSTWNDSYQTSLTSMTDFGPLCRFRNFLLVANGRYLATLDDAATWTAQRLTFPPGYIVRDIFVAGQFAIILCYRGSAIKDSEEGMAFLWNGTDQTYTDYFPITGNPHAGIALNNKIYIIAGTPATIQQSLGGTASIIMGIPNIGEGYTAEVYPGAIETWRNMIHFGLSDGTSTTVIRAVYSYGARSGKYSEVLNAEFPTSVGTLTGTGVQITAIKKVGTTIYFAWKSSSSYGIDYVDTTAYQAQGIYRSLIWDHECPYDKIPEKGVVQFGGALITGESVKLDVSPDPYGDPTFGNSNNDMVTKTENTVGAKRLELPLTNTTPKVRSADLHMQLTLAGPGTSTPSVKRSIIEISEEVDQI